MRDKSQRVYYLCLLIYALVLGYSFYDNAVHEYTHSLMMCFVSLGLMFLVPLCFRILHWKPVYEIYTLALVFMFLASVLGSAYRYYDHVLYWDKYVHCFSGVLGTTLSYLVFCILKKVRYAAKEDVPLMMVFISAGNIAIAALWELFEYAGLVLFDYDGIRHYTTGVHDSMTDIIVCIIGGIFASILIYHRYQSGKENMLTRIYDSFYQVNKK